MKLYYFIALFVLSLTIVNSREDQRHGQIVINQNDLVPESNKNEKHVQKKRIGNGHSDFEANTSVEWYSCSSADSVLIIDEIILRPDPPKRGKKVKIELYGFLLRDIEVGSRIKIAIKYGSILIYKDNLSLCDLVPCPMERGELYATYETDIYSYIPRGTYKADAYAWEPDNQEIACAYGKVRLV